MAKVHPHQQRKKAEKEIEDKLLKEILFKLVYRPFNPTKDFMTKEYTLLKRLFENSA